MKKKLFLFLLLILVFMFSAFVLKKGNNQPVISFQEAQNHQSFELQPGDILVRPNWWWLPGSSPVAGGRKYGHVAFVTKGAAGATIEEALKKAVVIEALFFDQASKRFQFKKENQVRQEKAIVSFGNKFTGIRYRLRADINPDQLQKMTGFLENQLDGGYDLLSMKEKNGLDNSPENKDWHCATIVWHAYYHALGIDIDSNEGIFIYPSDIIASTLFDKKDGRIRF